MAMWFLYVCFRAKHMYKKEAKLASIEYLKSKH